MKKYIFLLIPLLFLTACTGLPEDSNSALWAQQEQIMKESVAQVGMPAIVNFQEKKLMKQIFELRDQENIVTYTYIVAEMTGKLVFVWKSIGYGLPYATQYTNPMKSMEDKSFQWSDTVLPQADPNGLFMPDSAQGTWIMMIDKDGKPRPTYFEPNVVVSPFPLSN